jgi:hypothetical protein
MALLGKGKTAVRGASLAFGAVLVLVIGGIEAAMNLLGLKI